MSANWTEKRWSERQHLQLHVTLYEEDRPLLRTSSRDLSIGGIAIAEAPERVDIDQRLEIGFSLRGAEGACQHRLPARVVRNHENGAALAFCDYDLEGLNALRTLLYDALNG